MKSALTLLLISFLFSGCMRFRDGALSAAWPADSQQLAEVEDALADEQRDRMAGDTAVRTHADSADRAILNGILESQGMTEAEATELFTIKYDESVNAASELNQEMKAENKTQFDKLAGMITEHQRQREEDESPLNPTNALIALGVAALAGKGGHMMAKNGKKPTV